MIALLQFFLLQNGCFSSGLLFLWVLRFMLIAWLQVCYTRFYEFHDLWKNIWFFMFFLLSCFKSDFFFRISLATCLKGDKTVLRLKAEGCLTLLPKKRHWFWCMHYFCKFFSGHGLDWCIAMVQGVVLFCGGYYRRCRQIWIPCRPRLTTSTSQPSPCATSISCRGQSWKNTTYKTTKRS